MILNGTINRAACLLILTLVGAMSTWVGAVGGFVVALVTIFKKTWTAYTAPLYAKLEGLLIGAMSAMFEQRFPNIVMQAVDLTFGTLAALLMAFRSGLIKAIDNFKLGVVAAIGAIALLYLVRISGPPNEDLQARA